MKDTIYKIATWLGRKFLALIFMAILVLVSGIFAPDKIGSISIALTVLYGAFVGAHTTTDVMNRDKTTTTDIKVNKSDLTVKKEEKSDKPADKTEDADWQSTLDLV